MKIPQIYQSIPWSIIILIAGLIPLASALTKTGTADTVAQIVLNLVGTASPHLALFVLVGVAILLGQFMSNLATIMVMLPVAIAVAQSSGLSVQPFIMALAVACAASFLTPIATAGNMMVVQPGGYKFGDFWRLGLPIAVVYLLMAVFYVPLVWPF